MPDFGPVGPLDPDLARRIGQIVYRWSSLEYLISMLLATLLKADHGGMMVITNSIAIGTQTKWIRALLSGHPQEEAEGQMVTELLERADTLRTERNELIHGIWDTTNCEPRTALVQTVNLERAEIIRTRLVGVDDLDDLVIEIDQWIADYVKLGRQLGFPRRPGETKSIFAD
jgi:hypothetical protein